jgi:dihydropyrimidinase
MSFPTFDDNVEFYLRATQIAGAHDLVTLIHCEDYPLIELATRDLVAQGRTSIQNYPDSRPILSELVATQRAIAFAEATGATVYIVHLSSARAMAACAEAQSRGVPVLVETRPLYLHLTAERFEGADAGKYVGQPPLRYPSDVAALWAALQQGTLHTVCTDHAPWGLSDKLDPAHTIQDVRPGTENLQVMLPMLYSEGVRTGRISLARFVEVTSTNVAKIFGLYPRKGALLPGSDADLVIFDPELTRTINAGMLKSNADYSVFDGWEVTGWPVTTIRRGEVIFRDDEIVAQPGSGQLVQRNATELV